MGGKLDVSFESPYLTVFGEKFFEVDSISYALVKLRNLEKRLAEVGDADSKAAAGIIKGIEQHRAAISSEKGAYFPCFNVNNLNKGKIKI